MNEKIILKETKSIALGEPCCFCIADKIEGDLCITFQLDERASDGCDSFTRIETFDEHNATIYISNAPNKFVTPTQILRLGTYGGKYDLFVTFELTSKLDGENRNLSVEFISKKKVK